MTQTSDRGVLFRVWMDTPCSGQTFERKSRSEFGGPNSYRLHLRRVGVSIADPEPAGSGNYGIYMGPHDGRFVVVVKDLLTFQPKKAIFYDTLDDLKQEWELD